ncbi:MAG: hypothetical protein E3J25_02700, partial [Anaerolineales bacterium]
MFETTLILIGAIPALLIVLAGMLVLHVGPERTAGRRFLLFLLAVGVLLTAAVFVAGQLTPQGDNRPAATVSSLLAPALTGTLALIYLKLLARLRPVGKALAFLLGLVLLVPLAANWGRLQMPWLLLPSALLLAAVWVLVGFSNALAVALSLAS